MIRFRCTHCKQALEHAEPHAVVTCPKLWRRVRVPTPVLQSTPFRPPPARNPPAPAPVQAAVPAMSSTVPCPQCGAGVGVADHEKGMVVECMACGKWFPSVIVAPELPWALPDVQLGAPDTYQFVPAAVPDPAALLIAPDTRPDESNGNKRFSWLVILVAMLILGFPLSFVAGGYSIPLLGKQQRRIDQQHANSQSRNQHAERQRSRIENRCHR